MNKFQLLGAVLAISTTGAAQAVTISLNAGTEAFSGSLLEGSNNPNVGVIFFHGRQSNRDGDVVRHLSKSLNADGYTTLSIDNPVPAGGTSTSNYRANESKVESSVYSYFNAAVDSLVASNSNIDTIVVGGWSLGSRFALATAAALEQGITTMNSNVTLGGLLSVGMWTGIGETNPTTPGNINVFDSVNNLGLISSFPVLDLYGDLDSKAADTAADRMNAYAGSLLNYTQVALGCPDFNNTTSFTRDSGSAVPYSEGRCHQLRNGFLTEEDAVNQTNADVVLRGSADAPLESTAGAWLAETAPLTTVPVPAAAWLFGSGLLGLVGVARRKKS